MKKARVYTRTGDAGSSQLLSVGRVPKDHLRLVVYGDVDELNSVIGTALATGLSEPLTEQLSNIQHQLFVLGSQIAVPRPEEINFDIPQIAETDTHGLERLIDELDAQLPTLKNFIMPGGTPGAAHLHHARTVCRRCERHMQSLNREDAVPQAARTYVNRLSDYLFMAARFVNHQNGVSDTPWQSRS